MFRKSDKNPQLDAFSSPAALLQGSSLNHYLKKDSWHNIFREQVVMRVNEDIFKVLYCSDNGSPNASIRVLAGMMILKEGQGWSDEQLFEQCQYNLPVRSALGLMNLTDVVPAASTYYLFRKRITDYNRENNADLFEQCMQQITHGRILEFNVSGKQIRMDSKLIGSNISWYSRYELVHETLRKFIKEHEEDIYQQGSLSQAEFSLIAQIREEEGDKVVYRSTKKEIDTRFETLGKLMHHLVKLFEKYDDGEYRTLQSVFEQQFTVTPEKTILPRENEEISAQSIQSPHDPDCHYRNKDGNRVKGYSVNLTETCNTAESKDNSSTTGNDANKTEPILNLITDINVDVVSTPDSDFLESSIEESQRIPEDKIEKVYADGAYNSADNQAYTQNNDMELILTGLQGKTPGYELSLNEENDEELIVLDTLTRRFITAYLIATQKTNSEAENKERKWRIITDEGKYRYFTLENVRTSMLRQKLRDIPIEERWKRNNVEASIFQLGLHCTNGKTRYRGLAATRLWAYSRAMWINFRRIPQICDANRKKIAFESKRTRFFH